MKILVTGCAGFIGYHVCLLLLKSNKFKVYGLDNLNQYYDLKLKKDRLKNLKKNSKKFKFFKIDITNQKRLIQNFKTYKYSIVIHLAAQAGVRYSTLYPQTFINNNIIGFFNILESCKLLKAKHLIFASTSSVYGNNNKLPLKEVSNTDRPESFYAATKKSNELMAYSYSRLYNIPCTGLRLFTVYGPYGRPDMSLFKFTKAILSSNKVHLYNRGNHIRDFTYIDDVVNCIVKIVKKPSLAKVPFQILNVGSNKPKHLKKYLKIVENTLQKKAKIINKNLQKGDIIGTQANIDQLTKKINFYPKTSLSKGIEKFVSWYKSYYINFETLFLTIYNSNNPIDCIYLGLKN